MNPGSCARRSIRTAGDDLRLAGSERTSLRVTGRITTREQLRSRFRWWFALGVPVSFPVLVIFCLMIAKPFVV
jgi:uncharacterized membrane protein